MARLLQSCGQLIVSYHEHNSLLDHREEEELSEEERRAAWDEYHAEKKVRTANLKSVVLWYGAPSGGTHRKHGT